MAEIKIKDQKLVIKTPYHKQFVQMIKNRIHWSKRQWNPAEKAWVVEITESKEEAYSAIRTVKLCFKDYDTSTVLKQVEGMQGEEIYFGEVKLSKDRVEFKTSYDQDFVNEIKKIPNAKWSRGSKSWIIKRGQYDPNTLLKIFEQYKFKETKDYKTLVSELRNKLEDREKTRDLSNKVEDKNIEKQEIKTPNGEELYSFQKVGVGFISKVNGKVLIADEMGTGKTIQTLTYLFNNKDLRPVLIIIPASIKLKWKQEIEKWCPNEEIVVINGRKGKIKEAPFILVNYDIVHARTEQLLNIKFKCLVLDESHYIKNSKAKRTQSILKLSRNISKKICLTGTPILNRPSELFTTLKLLEAPELSNYWHYHKRYCDAKRGQYGWDVSGASNLDELQNKLRSSCMIRRLKKDVLSELPKKQRILIPIEITNRSEYDSAFNDFRKWYEENKEQKPSKNIILAQLEALKQLAIKGKEKAMDEFIRDASLSSKIVVFAHHRNVQNRIRALLNCQLLTGGLDAETKENIIRDFNKNNRPLVVSIKAGGVGIDLQSASIAIFTEITWTPADLLQAEDRLHRIGQETPVTIYYLIASNTIEETIYNRLKEKLEISSAALDNETADDLVFNIVDGLLIDGKDNNKTKKPLSVLPSNQNNEKTVVQIYDDKSIEKLDILEKINSIDFGRYNLNSLYKNIKRVKYNPESMLKALLYYQANNQSLLAFYKQLKYDVVLRNILGFDKKVSSYQQLWHFLNKRLGKKLFNKIFKEVI